MKWFIPHPLGRTEGILFDEYAGTRSAVFLTPKQAKFMASYKSVREAAK